MGFQRDESLWRGSRGEEPLVALRRESLFSLSLEFSFGKQAESEIPLNYGITQSSVKNSKVTITKAQFTSEAERATLAHKMQAAEPTKCELRLF